MALVANYVGSWMVSYLLIWACAGFAARVAARRRAKRLYAMARLAGVPVFRFFPEHRLADSAALIWIPTWYRSSRDQETYSLARDYERRDGAV